MKFENNKCVFAESCYKNLGEENFIHLLGRFRVNTEIKGSGYCIILYQYHRYCLNVMFKYIFLY